MAIKKVELLNQENRYRLYFSQEAYDKMRLYVELCQDEIGWLGYVDKLENDTGYFVSDVFLVKQEVHGTTTELDPNGIMEHYSSLTDEQQRTFVDKCRLWGHSHVNMGVTPSGQDDTQGKALSEDANDFYIRLITNKKGDYDITFYDKVINAKITTDEVVIFDPNAIELRQRIKAEMEEKVKKKTYTPATIEKKSQTPSPTIGKKTSSLMSEKITVSKIDIKELLKKEDEYNSRWLKKITGKI